jgi:hypothetical protein
MLKKYYLIPILFFCLSCSKNYDLKSKQGFVNLKKELIENLEDKLILQLNISTNSYIIPNSDSYFNSGTIEYKYTGDLYYQIFNNRSEIIFEEPKKVNYTSLVEKNQPFIIKEINFENIFNKIEIAKKMIEKPELFYSINLSNWIVEKNENKKMVHYITLYGALKKPDEIKNANRFEFEVDESGNIIKI